ncbi:UNVERIFIED_CONTAM: hypothetical protein FKN15_059637 [Acipenser sinensis]
MEMALRDERAEMVPDAEDVHHVEGELGVAAEAVESVSAVAVLGEEEVDEGGGGSLQEDREEVESCTHDRNVRLAKISRRRDRAQIKPNIGNISTRVSGSDQGHECGGEVHSVVFGDRHVHFHKPLQGGGNRPLAVREETSPTKCIQPRSSRHSNCCVLICSGSLIITLLRDLYRFKDGLATLNFLTALVQRPTVLQDFMGYAEKKLTASNLEHIFRVELSTVGSNRRRDKCRISGYLSDYLLDCEEQETAVSLEDVLMFATGLRSLPPAAIQPQPSMEFFSSSQFPTANTCGNILRLPYADNYDEFKSAMEFGIKNSPGFGCI